MYLIFHFYDKVKVFHLFILLFHFLFLDWFVSNIYILYYLTIISIYNFLQIVLLLVMLVFQHIVILFSFFVYSFSLWQQHRYFLIMNY